MTQGFGGYRSGFVCFVGRPNVGKSTLTNALVGSTVAIISDKPQTTRHIIKGIVTRPDAQLVVIDTPGLHRPRTLLGERLNALVHDTWAEVDVLGVCLPANQRIGPGDRHLLGGVKALRDTPKLVAVATKTDLVSPARLREHLLAIQETGAELGLAWEEIVPVSAVTGDQVGLLRDLLVRLSPEGPQYYPDGEITDEPTETLIAELIREAALHRVDDELPHSIAVVIDEMIPCDGGCAHGQRAAGPAGQSALDIYASIVVERDSQKPIVLGRGAARLKEIKTTARRRIIRLLGTPIHLDLHVKVMKEWQSDPKYLTRLGFVAG